MKKLLLWFLFLFSFLWYSFALTPKFDLESETINAKRFLYSPYSYDTNGDYITPSFSNYYYYNNYSPWWIIYNLMSDSSINPVFSSIATDWASSTARNWVSYYLWFEPNFFDIWFQSNSNNKSFQLFYSTWFTWITYYWLNASDNYFARLFYASWREYFWNSPDYAMVYDNNYIKYFSMWDWEVWTVYIPHNVRYYAEWNWYNLVKNQSWVSSWYEVWFRFSDLKFYYVPNNPRSFNTPWWFHEWISLDNNYLFLDLDWLNKWWSSYNSKTYMKLNSYCDSSTSSDCYRSMEYTLYTCNTLLPWSCVEQSNWLLSYYNWSTYSNKVLPYKDSSTVWLINTWLWNSVYSWTMGLFTNTNMWSHSWYWTLPFNDVTLSWNQFCYYNWSMNYCFYLQEWFWDWQIITWDIEDELTYSWNPISPLIEEAFTSWYITTWTYIKYYEDTFWFNSWSCNEFLSGRLYTWTTWGNNYVYNWDFTYNDNYQNIVSIPSTDTYYIKTSNTLGLFQLWIAWNYQWYLDMYDWITYTQDFVAGQTLQAIYYGWWYGQTITFQLWNNDEVEYSYVVTWYVFPEFSSLWNINYQAKYNYCKMNHVYTWNVWVSIYDPSLPNVDTSKCAYSWNYVVFNLNNIFSLIWVESNSKLANYNIFWPISCLIAWYMSWKNYDVSNLYSTWIDYNFITSTWWFLTSWVDSDDREKFSRMISVIISTWLLIWFYFIAFK